MTENKVKSILSNKYETKISIFQKLPPPEKFQEKRSCVNVFTNIHTRMYEFKLISINIYSSYLKNDAHLDRKLFTRRDRDGAHVMPIVQRDHSINMVSAGIDDQSIVSPRWNPICEEQPTSSANLSRCFPLSAQIRRGLLPQSITRDSIILIRLGFDNIVLLTFKLTSPKSLNGLEL